MPVKEKRGPVYMARVNLPMYQSATRKLSLVVTALCLKYCLLRTVLFFFLHVFFFLITHKMVLYDVV